MSKVPIPPEELEKGEELDFTEERERWNSYKLSDGTTLKVKLVLRGVKRLKKWNPDGMPVYAINATNVVRIVNVPRKFRRKPKPVTTPIT